eukprot:snap_masked-scaffold_4-processed-gene-17.34-mRNA-1 protein AED:1.00 eAED:1.00 QI:0/-1/0/0/-1/1/1/0/60
MRIRIPLEYTKFLASVGTAINAAKVELCHFLSPHEGTACVSVRSLLLSTLSSNIENLLEA